MPMKLYMLNEDIVHHLLSGELVKMDEYNDYVKDLDNKMGFSHHKNDVYIFYISDNKKRVIRLATSKHREYPVNIRTLDRMIEKGIVKEVILSDLKYFYPHLSKRVFSILGWSVVSKNVKQRCKTIRELKDLREETKGLTRMLWHHDYWDGPRSGVMLWNGEKCWFSIHQECNIPIKLTKEDIEDFHIANLTRETPFTIEEWKDYDFYREFKVYRVPEETMEAITYNHELFSKYVGTHTNYDENGCRHHNLAPYTDHGNFYNDRNSHKHYDLDLSKCKIVGIFRY